MRAPWPVLGLVLLVFAAACGGPAPEPVPKPVAVDWEAQADWAVRQVDPCALLPTPGKATAPHACETPVAGGLTMTVEVGGAINHFARYRSQVLEQAGSRVYLSYHEPAATEGSVVCRWAVPLSPTRAVWLEVGGKAGRDQACTAAKAAIPGLLGKLKDPNALADGRGPLVRWGACEPLLRVLGRAPADPQLDPIRDTEIGDPTRADECQWGDYRFAGRLLSFTVDEFPAEGRLVRIGSVPGRLTDYTDTCVINWAPAGTTPLATLRGGCDGLTDVATKIQALLAGPPPPVPPAPASLGMPASVSDEPDVAPACRISALLSQDCRAAKTVPVPRGGGGGGGGGEAIVAAPDAVDLACTLLDEAIEKATGQRGQVAYTKTQCLGSTADRSVDFTLEFDPASNLSQWEAGLPRVNLGGFPALVLDLGTGRELILSNTHDEQNIGKVRLDALAAAPLGQDTPERPTDSARLALGDRVATALMTRF
ncbi:hypothetical protein VSH64_08075 [Amycolatopsis rhabdoformis]|uniref:DUF3558 domain-containing protein n=1 Tax=Amycolatopsis rhabdoformis TaxID=1448059 RepID=A0ABZ1IEF1_9PSEU|nr:hypothetical protein [Amycolatopsis rhabdoformis]WSE32063.1 hypothetical protein VSH64_08075 [Amycolatopsis rhabdoformis]